MRLITQYSKIKFSDFIVLSFIIVLPFIISGVTEDKAEYLYLNTLPSFVSSVTSITRWILYGLSVLFTIIYSKQILRLKGISIVFMLNLFYFVQLLYALASQTDIIRYLALTTVSFSVITMIGYYFHSSKINILIAIRWIIYLQITLSIIVGLNSLLLGFRFQGFINNPNLFGLISLFWLTILLLPATSSKKSTFINAVFIFITLFTIIASGSRASFVGLLIIIVAFITTKKVNKVLIISTVVIIGFVITSYYIDLPFINRLGNIGINDIDEARKDFWDKAIFHIKNSLWLGNGMDAPLKLVNTGNIHNCYLRYLLTMGLFFSIMAFLFYFIFAIRILKDRAGIPPTLIGFIIAFTVMNFVEDYYVGIGSSAFLSFLIIIGLIIAFLNKPHKTDLQK